MKSTTSSNSSQTSSVFLTRQELADRWQCSVSKIHKLKGLGFFKIGKTGKALYHVDDVLKFEKKNYHNGQFCYFSPKSAA